MSSFNCKAAGEIQRLFLLMMRGALAGMVRFTCAPYRVFHPKGRSRTYKYRQISTPCRYGFSRTNFKNRLGACIEN